MGILSVFCFESKFKTRQATLVQQIEPQVRPIPSSVVISRTMIGVPCHLRQVRISQAQPKGPLHATVVNSVSMTVQPQILTSTAAPAPRLRRVGAIRRPKGASVPSPREVKAARSAALAQLKSDKPSVLDLEIPKRQSIPKDTSKISSPSIEDRVTHAYQLQRLQQMDTSGLSIEDRVTHAHLLQRLGAIPCQDPTLHRRTRVDPPR